MLISYAMAFRRQMQGVVFALLFTVSCLSVKGGEPIMLTPGMDIITSADATRYFKPLFTSIGQSLNSSLYTVAHYEHRWRIGLDLSFSGMFIPESQLSYDAALPPGYGTTSLTQTAYLNNGVVTRNSSGTIRQPTYFGGIATPVFSAPQEGESEDFPKQPASVGYLEGNNISFMSGFPSLRVVVGLPTRTQIRAMVHGGTLESELTLFYQVLLSQQINHFLGLFEDDSLIGIAVNVAYHNISRDPGISVSSFALGVHGSKTFESGLSLYAGMQVEDISGTIRFAREQDPWYQSKSPWLEVRSQQDLLFDVQSFTSFRALGGIAYRTGILELHADASLASQPTLAVGLTVWFMGSRGPETRDESKERGKALNSGTSNTLYSERSN